MSTGALLFGRYAYPPNRLGYCGPADHEALLSYVSEERAEDGLRSLERRFEGAYPYLTLIARANGIADPLDQHIVEAYWIGNDCLDRVDGTQFYAELDARARSQLGPREISWLPPALREQVRPHHVFTVFDLYMRTGMMRDARAQIILPTINACRVSWGQIIGLDGEDFEVASPRLELRDGRVTLSGAEPRRVRRQHDGRGLMGAAEPGDVIAIHWEWACDVLMPAALERLIALTQRTLELVNASLEGEQAS